MSPVAEAEDRSTTGLDRREMLSLSTAAALASLVPGSAAWAQSLASQVITAPEEALSVGFVAGSEVQPRSLPWLRKSGGGRVLPAVELPIGDQSLANETVLVRIHGLYPRVPPKRLWAFVYSDLIVWHTSEDPELPGLVPAIAWGSRRRPQRNVGQQVQFPVSLPPDGGLELTLGVWMEPQLAGGPIVEHRFSTRFTVDWVAGAPRLQQGLYLLGMTASTWFKDTRLPRAGEPIRDELCSLAVSIEAPNRW